MENASIYIIFDAIVWAAVFLVAALRFERTTDSPYELKRREAHGDKTAAKQLAYEHLVPRLETLRQLKLLGLLVVGSALSVAAYGWVVGVVAALPLVLFLGTISRLNTVATLAKRIFSYVEPWLMANITRWKWLDWFAAYTQPVGEYRLMSKDELRELVVRSQGVLNKDEMLRFQANLLLDELSVANVMTPVSVLDTAEVNDSLGPLVLDDLHKTGHSRFPVIDGDIHHVVGILYLHNLLDIKNTKKTVREAMDSHVHYINQDQTLEHALHGFLSTRRHMFIVVNNYEETVGVLTLEDVLEEVLGKKIVDEFDQFDDLRAVAASNPRANNQPKERTDI